MSRTFHLLTESDSFSKSSKDNLSRWVANVVETEEDSIVLAPSSDDSWSFPAERIRVVPGLSRYRALYQAGGYLLPQAVSIPLIRLVLTSALKDLAPGDTVWIHNRPEFAAAIAPFVQRAGARLFLHLHNDQLLTAYSNLLQTSKADCYIFNSQSMEQEALRMFPHLAKTAVLSGGLDPREFHPSEKHAFRSRSMETSIEWATVVFSAYLARETDLQVFLDAMEILRSRNVPVNGTVIGGPDLVAQNLSPNRKDRRMHVPSNVTFERYDAPGALGKKLRASELFCVPTSWHKSASLYMLEALACGLPVVATMNAGSRGDTIGAPGILIVPNAAEGLAQTVQGLVEDSVERQRLANMAYSTYTNKYMWHATRASYRSVLSSAALLSGSGSRTGDLVPA